MCCDNTNNDANVHCYAIIRELVLDDKNKIIFPTCDNQINLIHVGNNRELLAPHTTLVEIVFFMVVSLVGIHCINRQRSAVHRTR